MRAGRYGVPLEFGQLALVGGDELLGKHLRETAAALVREYRVHVAVHRPVLGLVAPAQQRVPAQAGVEALFQLFGIEAVAEIVERMAHGFEHRVLVEQQVLAHFARGIARPEILAFLADEQLLDRILGVGRQLERVVVARQHRGLVEPERVLHVGAAGEKAGNAFHELVQHLARILHHLAEVDRRVQLGTADAETVEERVDEVRCDEIGLREFPGDGVFLRLDRDLCRGLHFPGMIRVGRVAEQRGLELVVARQFVFVEQLDPGGNGFLGNERSDVFADLRLGLVERHDEAFAVIDAHRDLEIPELEHVAVEQTPHIALADGLAIAVDVDAVGTRVDEVVDAALEIDRRVAPGDVAIRVGQDPVVLQRTADRAAFLVEHAHGVIAHDVAMFGYDFELAGHDP